MAEFNIDKIAQNVAQRAIEKLNEMGMFVGFWISVSENMPEDGQDVLLCDIDGDIMVGHHVNGKPNTHFSQDGTYDYIKNVKAWMPLPDAYEPQESEVKECEPKENQ